MLFTVTINAAKVIIRQMPAIQRELIIVLVVVPVLPSMVTRSLVIVSVGASLAATALKRFSTRYGRLRKIQCP